MTAPRWTDEQARERYGTERVLAMLNRPDETDEAACAHWFGRALLTLEARIAALEDDRLRWDAVMECEYRATPEGFVHREDCRSCAKNVNALRGRITALEAERDKLVAALYPIVCELLTAEAREDAPEVDGLLTEAAIAALPECEPCHGTGSADGQHHEDEAREPCASCGGWGFFGPREGYRLSGASLRSALAEARRQGIHAVDAWASRFSDALRERDEARREVQALKEALQAVKDGTRAGRVSSYFGPSGVYDECGIVTMAVLARVAAALSALAPPESDAERAQADSGESRKAGHVRDSVVPGAAAEFGRETEGGK